MAWYWLLLGCMLSGSFGFVMCAIFVAGARSDVLSNGYSLPTGTRAERRRQWRHSWCDMKREV